MIEAQLTQGVAAHRAGNLADARALYEAVLLFDPQQADALGLLGLIMQEFGDLARARALMEASISVRPDVGRTHYNLGIVRTQQRDVAGAILSYEAAVRINSDFAEAHSNLANLYVQSGRRDDALQAYAAAIRAKPDFAAVYSNLAAVLIDLERYDEAVCALKTSLNIAPDVPEAHANLGQAYRRSGHFREAIAASARALELRPDYREAHLNLALAACDINEIEIALATNARAAELDASSPEVHCNRSRVFYMTRDYSQAVIAAEAAIALRPDYAEAHVNLALSLLHRGDFARGWEEYVWLWRVPSRRAQYPHLDRAALWNGEAFTGKKLLITRDQGFGDAIQMARYLPMVKERGGVVVMETLPALLPLFAEVPGIDQLLNGSNATISTEQIDFHVPLLGLPRAFKTDLESIPDAVPYLRAPPERVARWHPRLQRSGRLRIGIVWSGNPAFVSYHHRSATMEDFAPLGAIHDIAWFGLQKGRDEERRSCGAFKLEPLGDEIEDFGDTAAILTHLDLLIATDTAVVHLAGALAKPVWTLLAFAPDWRWLTERDDSPWYPTMRLFRQPRPGDWASVFGQVARELRTLTVGALRQHR